MDKWVSQEERKASKLVPELDVAAECEVRHESAMVAV